MMKRENIIPVLWLMLAAIIIGASIGFAGRADATPIDDAAIAICQQYDRVGATKSATIVMAAQMFEAGLDTDQAAELFAVAVIEYCPEYQRQVVAIMDDFAEGRW